MDDELVERLERLCERQRRTIVGIAGCPGAGKSTLAESLVDRIDPDRVRATCVPLDGFHLADAELDRLGIKARKGAIETFDAHGYLALLTRIRHDTRNTVYAPNFDRDIEQPVAGHIPVFPGTRLVLTEGNYLLDSAQPWPEIRAQLDEVWFCDIDDETRQARLVARHVRFGKTPAQAQEWVARVDERNAERIKRTGHQADLVLPAVPRAPSPASLRNLS